MDNATQAGAKISADSIQEHLTRYACDLNYDALPEAAIHAAKIRVIDTLGALIGGFFDEPCRIARDLAADIPYPTGATVIGTRIKTTPDLAAFVNSTTSRSAEMNDVAHKRGGKNGHPSDVVLSVLAAAEHGKVSGRDYITGVVLAYEVYLRFAESVTTPGFDATTFGCVGTATAAGKMLGLTPQQLAHCISMAAIPNNALNQSRTGHLSMWKAAASGQAGRAGVFAAMLARKGMEGPHLPFEGKNGWCNYVAQKQIKLPAFGNKSNGTAFRIQDTIIKPRPACYHLLAPIAAAEKVATQLKQGFDDVKQIVVEVYKNKERAMSSTGSSTNNSEQQMWNPQSRETADHSIPYGVAVALFDGTVTMRSFDDAHLQSPVLRALLKKTEIVENEEFSAAYDGNPIEHRTRVTVHTNDGNKLVGESGGKNGELASGWSDAEVNSKFRGVAEDVLGAKRVSSILDQLWNLDKLDSVAAIPPGFALD